VLDYGCGSGVLAIAAKKLGAGRVLGVDIDPRALEVSRDNAVANAVEIELTGPDSVPPGPYDVVLANILSNPLRLLAPLLAGLTRPGGKVVLAGILDQQAAGVGAAYARWYDMQVASEKDGWTPAGAKTLAGRPVFRHECVTRCPTHRPGSRRNSPGRRLRWRGRWGRCSTPSRR
jgi:ribosomal protein L11 methylase PrmA